MTNSSHPRLHSPSHQIHMLSTHRQTPPLPDTIGYKTSSQELIGFVALCRLMPPPLPHPQVNLVFQELEVEVA